MLSNMGRPGVATDTHSSSIILDNHIGYADYNDTSSAASPVALAANTWTSLPNNGLGAFSQDQLPNGTTTLLDSTGAIDASGLPLHSDIQIRIDYTVTPNVNNAALAFRYQLGAGPNIYFLERAIGRLDVGAGVGYRQSLILDYIYLGDENTRGNLIVPQVNLTSVGSVVNAGMAIKVYRK